MIYHENIILSTKIVKIFLAEPKIIAVSRNCHFAGGHFRNAIWQPWYLATYDTPFKIYPYELCSLIDPSMYCPLLKYGTCNTERNNFQKVNICFRFFLKSSKYHSRTLIIRFPEPNNIILDTKIIKISQVEPKIWNKEDALIFDGGHFEKSNMATSGSW